MEQKVRLVVFLLVAVFILNSIILFGQAKDNSLVNEKKNRMVGKDVSEKDYISRGNYAQKLMPVGYTNDYSVYVKNLGGGDYFRVTVYVQTAVQTEKYEFRRYIFSGEEERFYFREISRDKNYFKSWSYEIEN